MASAFAVVGTGAIAIAPVAQQSVALEQLKPLHTAAVEMTAFANPFNAILGSFNLVNNDLFNGFATYPGDIPQGIFPQLLDNPLPILRQVGDNLSYYGGNAIAALLTGPTSSANVFATMVWTLPEQLSTAFGELLSGDFPAALETLAQTFIAPIPFIIDGFVNAISTPIVNAFQHTLQVVTALPGIIAGGLGDLVGGVSLLTGFAIGAVTDVVTQLASFNIEGAWNTYVEAALSPSGFPGLLEQLTLGPGFTDPDTGDFFNSIRGWATEAQNTIRVALTSVASTTEEEAPSAAALAAPAAAVAASDAKVASDSAESSVADNAKAAAAASDADTSAPAAAASDDSSAPAGDSKADAKADTDKSSGSSAKSSGGKGHSKNSGARKAASE
jgi:hypothetical protein